MSKPGKLAHDAFMAACVNLGMHEGPHQWQHKPAKMRAAWAAVEAAIRADQREMDAQELIDALGIRSCVEAGGKDG